MTQRDSEIVRQEIEAGGPKAVLSGLIFSCPANRVNPQGCPLRPIRCLHTADRYRWLLRLSDEQASDIVKKHSDCIGEFEK